MKKTQKTEKQTVRKIPSIELKTYRVSVKSANGNYSFEFKASPDAFEKQIYEYFRIRGHGGRILKIEEK